MEYSTLRKIVKDSIESGLSVIGDGPKDAIITHFLKRYRLRSLEDVAEYSKEFEEFLKLVFGAGAMYLLKAIVKKMFENLDLEYISTEMSFSEAVSEVRKMVKPIR
ncbi:MAG: hypothetical protein ACPLZF_03145 [Nitrososphaeria archaeon]